VPPVNRFSKFCTAGKRMKFAIKSIRQYPPHVTLGMLLHYLGKLKIRIFLQIFSKYGRKCKQIAFWAKRWIPISRDISPTALWVCGLSSWLKTKLLNFLNVFFSAGTARSPAAWRPVNCAYVPQLFQQLINITLCPVCLMKFVCQSLCCVPLQIETFYQNLVLVAEYPVDC